MFKPLFMEKKASKKRAKMASGGEVLQALFENGNSPLSVQFIRWKLWKKWSEFVGPTMAGVCEPVGYSRGVLYIWVRSSSWMQQLVFMREQMKETINQKLNQNYVGEIRLTMDRRAVPLDAQGGAELKESIESIESSGAD